MARDLDRFQMNWQSLRVVLEGQSAIDVSDWLQINSLEEAEKLLASYGFFYQNPIHQAETYGHYQEAISFIRRFFLKPENEEGVEEEIPKELLSLKDIRYLFILASKPNNRNGDLWREIVSDPFSRHAIKCRLWAGAILKVLHTVSHIDKDIRSDYFAEIQKQVLDQYYKFLVRDDKDQLYLDFGDERIRLLTFETKPKKSRDSLILKLLHKPENVAENIFDRIGIRLVSETRLDALRILDGLIRRQIVMPANLKPSRSHNTLIDLDGAKSGFDELRQAMIEGRKRPRDLEKAFNEALGPIPEGHKSKKNPHSSVKYHALQFTARQLITYENPVFGDLFELRQMVKQEPESLDHLPLGKTIKSLVNHLDSTAIQREIRFFYPYEIQLMDQASFHENLEGEASHMIYRKNQIRTALKRVMGPLCNI
jgi:uncharacterized protein (TIGR04562 family)